MPRKIIILENIRSAYNVGNVIRTADALGREVRITGYTPSPLDHPKVKKTSLGAEDSVALKQFDYTSDAITYAKEQKIGIIAAEITPDAIDLQSFSENDRADIAIVFGNEVEGVLLETLKTVDQVVFIPMQGVKESLNIGQSTAIFMRALR
ncbi:TrmH family RNA methyltransferase [Candidatus Gracilibacteria bacterium]|nr:TrmH family RNA methyltransferase [Candidatus Gracilibacteria bacterium]